MAAITGKKLESTKCGRCSYSSKRITNVEAHIHSEHGVTAQQLYDEEHPGSGKCRCGCRSTTTWLNYKVGYSQMLRGHNANIYAIYDDATAKTIAMTRGSNWRNKPSWAKGLTKETDERIAARGKATSDGRKNAFRSGELVPWSKGLTKETDERIANNASAIKDGFASGRLVPWARGLTKETDDRVAKMALSVSHTHRVAALRTRLDEMKRMSEQQIKERVEGEGSTLRLVSIDNYVNDMTPNVCVECTKCGERSFNSMRRLQRHRCYTCHPTGSAAQASLASFIESLGVSITKNDRTVVIGEKNRHIELDIFVPSHNLAIEYNGLYWHSLLFKSEQYHQEKSDRCAEAGITLVHVFEDEWRDKRQIIESMLRHRLKMTVDKVSARACTIKDLGSAERKAFFDANHVDGDTKAMRALGLVDPTGRLVSALSLRVPFHRKHRETSIEVARMAGLLNTNVRGGLSRLTTAAKNVLQGRALMSYVDTRHGGSSAWHDAGWQADGETSPRFWWTDMNVRLNRFKYRADFERKMSEEQVADEAGMTKIYGCKNIRYVMSC